MCLIARQSEKKKKIVGIEIAKSKWNRFMEPKTMVYIVRSACGIHIVDMMKMLVRIYGNAVLKQQSIKKPKTKLASSSKANQIR